MGRIAVFDDPTSEVASREVDFCGPFIDWLCDNYPHGFPGDHYTTLNLERLPVADYDVVLGDHDTVTLTVFPGEPVTIALVAAVVLAVAAVAYSVYTMSTMKKPASPAVASSANSTAVASPTYTLSTPTNVVRLGQPIPVAYGRNIITPDIASQPYAWMENNEQYIGTLFCLGQGYFDIHTIYAAGTPISYFGTGTMSVSVYPPASHGQAFGLMQGATGVYENIYTSPEASDLELVGQIGTGFDWQNAECLNIDNSGFYGAWFRLSVADQNAAQTIYGGRGAWLVVRSGPDIGYHRIGFMFHSASTGPAAESGRYIAGHLEEGVAWSQEGTHLVGISYKLGELLAGENRDGNAVGYFNAVPVEATTGMLQFDLTLPGGAYNMNSLTNSLEDCTVGVRFTIQRIDNDNNPTGAVYSYSWSETFATMTRQRRSLNYAVPNGRYRVMAVKTTCTSSRSQDNSQVFWTGLKSVLGNTFGGQVYGDVTMLMMKMKASNGLAQDTATRITVDCTRKLNGVATRSPVDAFRDIATNTVYGGTLSSAELDNALLATLDTAWAGRVFDAVFDSQVTVWEALGYCLQMIHATPTMLGSLISIVEDRNFSSSDSRALITEDAIKALTLSYLFSDGQEPDGVEVEYRHPNDNAALYAIYPPSSVRPETMVGWGCRNYDAALAYARQRWNTLRTRRRLVSMDMELDGHVLVVGTPVMVKHRLLGANPVMCVINAVNPKDEFATTIDLHIHESGAFA